MSTSFSAKYDIVIAGGGMVGLLLACALGDSQLKIALVERGTEAPQLGADYDLRVSAVTLASCAMFQAVGAWAGMQRRRISPLREMRVWEGHEPLNSRDPPATVIRSSIHFDSADIGEPCLGYVVENSVITAALLERVPQFTNVHYLASAEIADVSLTDREVGVTLTDGRGLRARLLVGADGADSRVRQATGIETRGFGFDQKGIVATVTTAKPHQATAWQRFLPTGPVALLPLADMHTSSIVWSADTAHADALLAFDDDAFSDALYQAIGGALGELRSVSPRAAFPLSLVHAKSYVMPRVALVGDAAHVVHPLAGQGVNLGFLDAAALAEVILDAVPRHGTAAGSKRAKDIGDIHVLRRYERWRKGDNLAMLAVTGGFKQLFGNSVSGMQALRRFGLAVTDGVTPVKRLIMRRASGLDGDLPTLARRQLV